MVDLSRRISLVFAAGMLLPGVAALCGGCRADSPEATFPATTVETPDPGATGSVTGIVRFLGEAPKRRRLAVNDAWCGSLGREILSEDVIVENGALANVFCWISDGLDAWTWDWERKPAIVNQEGCVFVPHVLAARVRQPIRFLNSDATVHNVHTARTRAGRSFVFSMSPNGGPRDVQFLRPEEMLPVRCDIHSNMIMYICLVDHPLFAVTGRDGRFRIDGIPAGSYPLTVRHERLGNLTVTVTIKPGEVTTLPDSALQLRGD